MGRKIIKYWQLTIFILLCLSINNNFADNNYLKCFYIDSKINPIIDKARLGDYLSNKIFKTWEVKVEELSLDSEENKKIINKINNKILPVVFFQNDYKANEDRDNLINQLQNEKAIEKRDEYYIFNKDLIGISEFTDRELNRNTLDIFLMCKCPYSVKLIQQLIPQLKENREIQLRGFYYLVDGEEIYSLQQDKKQAGFNNKKYQFKSQFGISDVEESKRQLIIKKYYPDKFFDYLEIRSQNIDSTLLYKIYDKLGIKQDVMHKKMELEGDEFLKENLTAQKELGIKISPTLFWENKYVIIDFKNLDKFDNLKNIALNIEGKCY